MGMLRKVLSVYIRTIFCCYVCILIGAAPTRKYATEIPEAPFKDGCRILLNEIYPAPNHPYFELGRYCEKPFATIPQNIDIGKYAIVMINKHGFINGFCKLSGKMRTDGFWYYLVGDTGDPKTNFNMDDCTFETSNGVRGELDIKDSLAIVLIKNDRISVLEKFNLIEIGEHKIPRSMTPELNKILMGNLQDLYVVGLEDSDDIDEIFFKYYSPSEQSLFHIVRISRSQLQIKSISRCTARSDLESYFHPFQSQHMKITRKSPGRINECSPSISEQPPSKRSRLQNPEDSSNLREDRASQAENENFADIPEFGFNALPVDEFERLLENNLELFWENCEKFDKEKIRIIQSLPEMPFDIHLILQPPTCTWIDYIIPKKKLICKLCKTLLTQKIIIDRPGSCLLTKIMKDGDGRIFEGQLDVAHIRSYNKKIIRDHENSVMHRLSSRYLELFKNGKRGEDLKKEFQHDELYQNFFKASRNIALAVVQSVRMNTAFRSYKTFAETLDYFGILTGHLYRTPQGFRMLSDIIGEYLHKDLVSQLLKHKPEISITLDTTTDIAGYGLLGILFQTIDSKKNIKVHLYRIIHLRQGEKGETLFNAFLEGIIYDGLDEYLREKLVGLTTDGHPAVRSVFRKMLNEFVDNELVGVWCGAHLLELAAAKAFESFEYLVQIDTIINRTFRLLTAKSPIRREEFRSQIPKFGVRLFGIPKVRRLRWLMHHVRALAPYIFRFPILIKTLEALATEKELVQGKLKFKYNLKTRTEARDLLLWLKDPTFLLTVAFTADVLEILADLSLDYQREGSSLIGKRRKRDQLVQNLSSLEHNYGKHVSYVLSNSKIVQGEIKSNPLLNFESNTVEFNGILMNDPEYFDSGYTISEKMEEYIDAVLNQIEEYYPPDTMDNYDILVPSLLPQSTNLDGIETYGVRQLLELKKRYRWTYTDDEMIGNWRDLCLSLTRHPDFQEYRLYNPEKFWTHFLQATYIEWTPITTEIIQKALTVPASSSQPERIFSMYAYVKTYSRYNLLPPTVENIIRIKFNGPKELSNWNFLDLGREIVAEGHSRPDDESRRKTWRKMLEEESEDGDSEDLNGLGEFGIEDLQNFENLFNDGDLLQDLNQIEDARQAHSIDNEPGLQEQDNRDPDPEEGDDEESNAEYGVEDFDHEDVDDEEPDREEDEEESVFEIDE